jgi:hypothetical protein
MRYITRLLMERAIAYKLTQELGQEIDSERQVVYILVELRKLLEQQRLDKDERYQSLMFCCNWAAHSKMSRSAANEITLLFDRYETIYRTYWRWSSWHSRARGLLRT